MRAVHRAECSGVNPLDHWSIQARWQMRGPHDVPYHGRFRVRCRRETQPDKELRIVSDQRRLVRVLVEDEEFGEDFHVRATIGAVIAGLREAAWATVYRVPNPDGTIALPDDGVWLCVRVGDE